MSLPLRLGLSVLAVPHSLAAVCPPAVLHTHPDHYAFTSVSRMPARTHHRSYQSQKRTHDRPSDSVMRPGSGDGNVP